MSNAKTDSCGTCLHLKNDTCSLRNELIELPNLTTCGNWNDKVLKPAGTLFSLIDEVRGSAITGKAGINNQSPPV